MARVALQCLVLIHILLAVALVSMPPGPTRTRLQCPSCSKAFGSETALRQHRAALGRKGGPEAGCMFDLRLPIESGWSGRGQRAAGMVQNMNRATARLAGLDSDSGWDSDSDGGHSAGNGGPGGQSPMPPADSDSDHVPGPPADPLAPAGGPAAPPAMPQVHRIIYLSKNTYTYVYIRIHTFKIEDAYKINTYRYKPIHADTVFMDQCDARCHTI